MKTLLKSFLAVTAALAGLCLETSAQSTMNGCNFEFKNFVIVAWWGPGNSEAQVAADSQAGFNTIMAGRLGSRSLRMGDKHVVSMFHENTLLETNTGPTSELSSHCRRDIWRQRTRSEISNHPPLARQGHFIQKPLISPTD